MKYASRTWKHYQHLWIRQQNHEYYFVCGKYYYKEKILLNLRFLSSYQTSTRYEKKNECHDMWKKLQYLFRSEIQTEMYTQVENLINPKIVT